MDWVTAGTWSDVLRALRPLSYPVTILFVTSKPCSWRCWGKQLPTSLHLLILALPGPMVLGEVVLELGL